MTDINSIKAGQYELVADVWDEPTSKPGEPFTFTRHYKGATVELDESEARRLFRSGAVVEPGSREKRQAASAAAQFRAALAQVPDDVRAELLRQLGASTPEVAETAAEDGEGEDPANEAGSGENAARQNQPRRNR